MATATNNMLTSLALLLNRVAMGLFFLMAGVGKIRGGVGNFVNDSFKKLQPDWLPDWVAAPYAWSLPFLEIVLGAMLMIGLLTRITASVICLMILSFTIAIAVNVGITNHGSGPFSANVVMITLTFLLAVVGSGMFSADRLLLKRKA